VSELNDLIASSTIHAYNSGIEQGRHLERDRIIQKLAFYFELTQVPGDTGVDQNEEWDAGFQAAIALIKGEQK
jgi:hypothetical protein